MYREFYSALPSTALPIAVMLFFLAAFAIVVVRTFVLKRRRDYDPIAALPLADTATAPSGDPHECFPVESTAGTSAPREVNR